MRLTVFDGRGNPCGLDVVLAVQRVGQPKRRGSTRTGRGASVLVGK